MLRARSLTNLLLATTLFISQNVVAQEIDLILHNGSVIDGSGSPAIKADA